MTASRQQDYISLARQHNKAVWDGISALVALQSEWDALDYGNTLEDGAGANSGITRAEVSAVVNTTADALVALLAQGHATNMAKLL